MILEYLDFMMKGPGLFDTISSNAQDTSDPVEHAINIRE